MSLKLPSGLHHRSLRVGVWVRHLGLEALFFRRRPDYGLLFGLGSLAAGVGLIFYERYFLKKLKDVSYCELMVESR